MPAHSRISLARKCQLLFGAAVLSSIAASLFLPGVRMFDLTEEGYLRLAKETARTALHATDLTHQQDWGQAAQRLARDWNHLRKLSQDAFPTEPPRLIPLAEVQAVATVTSGGFLAQALAEFRANPQVLFKYKVDHDEQGREEVRLVMAVHAAQTDPDPGALLGIIEVRLPVDPGESWINMAALAAAVACGALLAVLVFYLVTQKLLLSPVRKLRRLAEQVTTGDMEVRASIATGDEFEDLGEAFNDMLIHLQSTQEELRKINRSLDTRLGELAETNVALFESNKLKGEFIANVSHELRTPLVSIIGFAELLVEAGENPAPKTERIKRYAQNILTSGRMLLDIINDLLDLAKIEAGKLELHIVECNPHTICEALVDFLTPMADKKKIALSLDFGDHAPTLTTDAGRIKQILYNLVSNAIKFTPEGGQVTLAVRAERDSWISFAVSDTGPGIPPEKQEMIFEKFRQVDSSMTREYEGTGLGLAITRELCTLLGGYIELRSQVNEGSTFTVHLPVEAPTDVPRPLINLTM